MMYVFLGSWVDLKYKVTNHMSKFVSNMKVKHVFKSITMLKIQLGHLYRSLVHSNENLMFLNLLYGSQWQPTVSKRQKAKNFGTQRHKGAQALVLREEWRSTTRMRPSMLGFFSNLHAL